MTLVVESWPMPDVLRAFVGDGLSALRAAQHEPLRRPEKACDLALTGTARHWLRRLPGRRRPLRLCTLYPRVANRLAWCWANSALADSALEDLLSDRRGGRRGFPTCVVRELQRLREFNQQQRVEQQPEGWWQAMARRALE
jgi:hypothetical protein